MELIMPRFDKAQVLVVGDIMLDRYWYGPTARISPEAPVPVVKIEQAEERPGGAGNVALNVASLGAGVTLVGATGEDEAADSLQARLQAANVACNFVRCHDYPTSTKLRVISRNQQLLRMDFEEPVGIADSVQINQIARQLIQPMGAIILSDYAKGVLNDPQTLIQAARAANIPVLVDPKGSDFSRYQGATLLTPNIHELEAVVGSCSSEKALIEKGMALIESLQLGALLVTRGEHGMTLLQTGQAEFHLPARAREVFDVTGAGDTVVGVLAAALAAGQTMHQAVALANVAAGLAVAKLGTAALSAPELRREVLKEQGSERGVLSLEQLSIAIDDARAHGESIVFTNGCFDIIHAGHVGYLEQARKLGDRLIVAINGDASVTRLKGVGRPINPVDRRMAVLGGLESVDWVVSFDDDTPESLLELLNPDVLVKGGDYEKESVVGWQIVEAYGGMVKVLSFFDDCSTTAIVQKMLE